MSPADSSKKPGGPYRKPRPDVYTVLLILALIALLLGILCLYFEMDMYDWKTKGGPMVSIVDRFTPMEMARGHGPQIGEPKVRSWPPFL